MNIPDRDDDPLFGPTYGDDLPPLVGDDPPWIARCISTTPGREVWRIWQDDDARTFVADCLYRPGPQTWECYKCGPGRLCPHIIETSAARAKEQGAE